MRRSVPRLTAAAAAATALFLLSTGTAFAQDGQADEPDSFTSMFTVSATPDMVIGQNGQPAPGQPGASGEFDYRINSDDEIICYDLTLRGVTGEYASPARTATHIHEAVAGKSGPPRIAFPNPTGDGDNRTSSGCLQGPFTTGVMVEGQDSGTGFSLKEIEANPSSFFGDTHTQGFTAGAVRGQLTAVPMGGVETGAGGSGDAVPYALGAAGIVAAAGAGTVLARRSRARS